MATLPIIQTGVPTIVSPPGCRFVDATPGAPGTRYVVVRDSGSLDYSVQAKLYGQLAGGGGVWYPLSDWQALTPGNIPVSFMKEYVDPAFQGAYALIFGTYTRFRILNINIETHF